MERMRLARESAWVAGQEEVLSCGARGGAQHGEGSLLPVGTLVMDLEDMSSLPTSFLFRLVLLS